jgi:hypothetical protein
MSKQLTGIPADLARSYASIERVATAFREGLGLDSGDRFEALKFFDEDIADITLEANGSSIAMIEGVEDCPQEGLTRWDPVGERLEVVLAEHTYEMLQEDHVRARSTVAHEAGHAVLHTEQIIRLAGMNLKSQVAFHRERNPHKAFRDTEWQANAFQSSLLMPAAGVQALAEKHKGLSAADVANAYRVSQESATYRLLTYRRSLGI